MRWSTRSPAGPSRSRRADRDQDHRGGQAAAAGAAATATAGFQTAAPDLRAAARSSYRDTAPAAAAEHGDHGGDAGRSAAHTGAGSRAGAAAQTAPAAPNPPASGTPSPAAAPVTAPPAADAAAAPPAAPAAGPGEAIPETVENPYGLSALSNGGDFVARGTVIALLLMSIGSWYVIITKLIEQTVLCGTPGRPIAASGPPPAFARAPTSWRGAAPFAPWSRTGSTPAIIIEGTLTEQIDLNTWITMSLQRSVDAVNNRLQGGLALLATVGSTAPFVGLFGTVWGLPRADRDRHRRPGEHRQVAGPVGEALIASERHRERQPEISRGCKAPSRAGLPPSR